MSPTFILIPQETVSVLCQILLEWGDERADRDLCSVVNLILSEEQV